MPKRPVTPRVISAAKRNIFKAQTTRTRRREPRSMGRARKTRQPRMRR